jgi:hypothetical protein
MPGMFCSSVSTMNNSRSGALMPCARSTSTVRFEKPRPLELLASEYGSHPTVVGLARARRHLNGGSVSHVWSHRFDVAQPLRPELRCRLCWGGVVKRRLLCAIKWFLDPRNARPPEGPVLPRLARAAADSRAHWSAVRLIHTWPQRAASPGINSATRVAPERHALAAAVTVEG